MTDVFVLLQLPNAGDDLQAIKKGIVELADLIVDQQGRPRPASAPRSAEHSCERAAMLRPASPHWQPPVLGAVGARPARASPTFWREVVRCRDTMQRTGEFAARRRGQALDWMWT